MKSKKESEDISKDKAMKSDKKDNLEKLCKEKSEKKNKEKNASAQKSQSSSVKVDKEKLMSDAEEKKWLKALNAQKNTFMYRLSEQKSKEENTNEKPW